MNIYVFPLCRSIFRYQSLYIYSRRVLEAETSQRAPFNENEQSSNQTTQHLFVNLKIGQKQKKTYFKSDWTKIMYSTLPLVTQFRYDLLLLL